MAAQLLGTCDNIDVPNEDFFTDQELREGITNQIGLHGMLGAGRVNANRALSETIPAPRIEGIKEAPDGLNGPVEHLTVRLGSVFETSTWTRVPGGLGGPRLAQFDCSTHVGAIGPLT